MLQPTPAFSRARTVGATGQVQAKDKRLLQLIVLPLILPTHPLFTSQRAMGFTKALMAAAIGVILSSITRTSSLTLLLTLRPPPQSTPVQIEVSIRVQTAGLLGAR
jgi:hypothetical protein